MKRRHVRISALIVALAVVGGGARAQQADEKLPKRVEKTDEKFLKGLGELAVLFNEQGDSEAAHFFAECYLGFRKDDEKIRGIWLDWEQRVYLGKDRGGAPFTKTSAVSQKLGAPEGEYKKVLEELLGLIKDGVAITPGVRTLFQDCAIKYEICRSAADYVRSIKRINELRKGMGLRAVLWDFSHSIKLILASACWAMDLNTLGKETEKHRELPFYSPEAMKLALEECARGYGGPTEWLDRVRGYALSREAILNPTARRLWLGHWSRLDGFTEVTSYQIPLLAYREDIPTPTERHKGKTVSKDWVDTEETIEIDGRKIPLVKYPYEGEQDARRSFGEPGKADIEGGWSKTEHTFLRKAGVPIMLRLFGEVTLTEVKATLETQSGASIRCRVYTNGDERIPGMGDWPTVLVVPEIELQQGAEYTVFVQAKLNTAVFRRNWNFKTSES